MIPDDLIQELGLDETSLRQELAVALFRQGKATLPQSCRLAGLDEAAFRDLVAAEDKQAQYGVTDFEEDLATLARQETV